MNYVGEFLALGVAISWTATALFAEVASKHLGSLMLNVFRMLLSLLFLGITLWVTVGVPYPEYADLETWLWLGLSGFIGYVLGDYCLFQSYVVMNSRFGQLFMTLASPAAAVSAWLFLGEGMKPLAIFGMILTITGIAISIIRDGDKLVFPLRGVLYAIGGALGTGVGLVISKIGMLHYEQSVVAAGGDMHGMIPFASTMIRATIGLIGFCFTFFVLRHKGWKQIHSAITDQSGMVCTIGAAIFGPFVGVSLALMSTLYTSAGIAQTIMATTPVLIILPSWLLFKQKITFREIIGAVISVVGVALFFI